MWNELVGQVSLKDVTYAGIVTLVILMILTDRLVTRKRLDDAREDGKAWQTSAENKDKINAELSSAVQELLPLARATLHALESIQSLGRTAMSSTSEEAQR